MKTHHRTIRVDGQTLFYREAGPEGAPVLLLLHGAPASSAMFRDLIPALADRYRVIAPDYPGFGLSDTPDVGEFEYTFEHLTNSVEQFLSEMGVDRFAMYVQDYGAPVGWRLYLRDPSRVTAIISQNGNAYEEGFVQDFWAPLWRYAEDHNAADEKILRQSLDVDKVRWQYTEGLADPTVVDPNSWIRDSYEVNRPGCPDIQLALYADYPTNRALYPVLQEAFRAHPVPALIVWGGNDPIFAKAGAEAFLRDLPNARLELLEGGHWLLESHLDEVSTLIREFLAGIVA